MIRRTQYFIAIMVYVFSNLNAISIELWIKQAFINCYQFFVSMTNCTFRFGFKDGGNFFCDMGRHYDRNYTNYSSTSGIWKQAVLIGNLEGGTIKSRIYLDGILVVTQDEGFDNILDWTDIFIGSRQSNNIFLLNRSISTSRVYNRALNNAEILQNFNAKKTRFGL